MKDPGAEREISRRKGIYPPINGVNRIQYIQIDHPNAHLEDKKRIRKNFLPLKRLIEPRCAKLRGAPAPLRLLLRKPREAGRLSRLAH